MDSSEESNFDRFVRHGEEYLKTKQELSKLLALQKASSAASAVFSTVVLFFLFFFVIVFASVALAYYIASLTGQTYFGFISVAVLYLLAGLILKAKKKSLLERPIEDTMIQSFFKPEEDEKD